MNVLYDLYTRVFDYKNTSNACTFFGLKHNKFSGERVSDIKI